MFDEMVTLLKAEQSEDSSKKAYCIKSFDETEDEARPWLISLLGTTMRSRATMISCPTLMLVLRPYRSRSLSWTRAWRRRFVTLTANNAAASELLKLVVNRLNKFYTPKLHKAAPKAELSAEDREYVNMGGEITIVAPTGVGGTHVARLHLLQAVPVAEPLTSKLEKDHEGFNGVSSLIGSLFADLAKETQEAKVDEEHPQLEYEAFMSESAASRADKVKELEELQDAKASVSASLTRSKEELASAVTSAARVASPKLRLAGSEFRCSKDGPC